MSTGTEDRRELSSQIKRFVDRLAALEKEKGTVSVVSSRFDEILLEKNSIRIKLTALRIRLENLGGLCKYALPDSLYATSVPRSK